MAKTPQPLSFLVRQFLRPVSYKSGYIQARIKVDWPLIVGKELSSLCYVRAVSQKKGILYVGTKSSFSLSLSFYEDKIKKRVNLFFGENFVNKIKFIHA